MLRVLILGANGSIAREATKLFLNESDAVLTLYLRKLEVRHSLGVSKPE